MQPETRGRRGLINEAVTAANIKSDSIAGNYTILNGAGGVNGHLVVPPIRKGSIRDISWKASSPEKQQFVLIAGPDETIAVNTSYSVSMQFPRDRFDGATHNLRIFRTKLSTAGANAAADRKAVYEALASKINAYVPNYTKAKIGYTLATKSTGARNIAKGTLVYLVGGTYVAMVTKAVSADGVDSDLVLELVDYFGTRPEGIADVFAIGSAAGTDISKTSSAYTFDTSLVVFDEAGYFPSKERLGRGGAPIIFTKGFSVNPDLLQAHSYSNGIGADMLGHTPEFDLTNQNMTRGRWENQYTEAPVSTSTYTEYIIRCMGGGTPDAVDGRNADIMVEHILFVKEATAGTPVATFKTAILALT